MYAIRTYYEPQQTDYPRTRPDLPNHEPRGCPRGASYSWYLYSANRLKYPKVRKPLLKLWREERARHAHPVDAWAAIVEDPARARSYKSARGMGGFVRSSWDEVNEIIASANIYTIRKYGRITSYNVCYTKLLRSRRISASSVPATFCGAMTLPRDFDIL